MVESDFFALLVAEVVSEVCTFQNTKRRDCEMATLGYLRVSTNDKQSTDSQRTALDPLGVDRWFEDRGVSGSTPVDQRAGWTQLREFARAGDTVVVARLDRIARSVTGLVGTVEALADHDIAIRSAAEAFDINPASPTSKLLLTLLGAVAEFERSLIRARVREGLDAARERGIALGRPRALDDDRTRDLGLAMLHRGSRSASSVAQRFGVSRASAYRALNSLSANEGE